MYVYMYIHLQAGQYYGWCFMFVGIAGPLWYYSRSTLVYRSLPY